MPTVTTFLGGGGGALGSLYVRLNADSTDFVRGMSLAVSSVGSASTSITKGLDTMAKAAVGAFAIVAAAGVNEFAKFDAAMTKSLAIMGKVSEGTRKQMETMARGISRESITAAADVAFGFHTLASAGYDAEQAMKALPAVERFAVAGMMDMTHATQLLADAQTSIGLRVDDSVKNLENMVRISDVLSKANVLAQASVEEFAEALTNKAAGALRQANKGLEEGVAVLAALALRGDKGAEAGTHLYMVLRDLQRTALKNGEGFRELNIQVLDAQNHMLPMADIIGSMEVAFGKMSAGQKKAALEMLGFQDRALSVILDLLGTSDAIREFEQELGKAGGTTKEISDKILSSFSSQLKNTWRIIQDILISFGEGMAPTLLEFNKGLKEAMNSGNGFNETIKEMGKLLGGGLKIAVETIGGIFSGWTMLLQGIGIVLVWFGKLVLDTFNGVLWAIQSTLNGAIHILNIAIDGINAMIEKLPDWAKPGGTWKIPTISFQVPDLQIDALTEWSDLLGSMQEDLWKDLVKTSTGMDEQAEKVVKGNKKAAESVNQVAKSMNLLKESAEDAFDASFAVSQLLTSMEKRMGLQDAMKPTLDRLEMLRANKLISPEEEKKQRDAARGTSIKRFGLGLDLPGVDDHGMTQALKVHDELDDSRKNLDALRRINEQKIKMDDATAKRRLEIMEAYNRRTRVLQLKEAEMAFSSASSIFSSLTSMAETWGGKQSALYKTMFAASKAFAIAEATVKIALGIAEAAGTPWPANLAAMASVAAATASIVSSISAVQLEFGGEKAMGGPVDSGKAFLVGERGPEIFVPASQGNIVPNNRIGGAVKVIVNNHTDSRPEIKERQEGGERVIEVLVQRVKKEIGSDIRDGRGDVTKAMESSFRLRRG